MAPDPALDAATTALVEREAQRAYERGVRDGTEQAQAQVATVLEQIAGAATAALRSATADLRAARAHGTGADVDIGLAIAEAVLGHEPHDGGQGLVARLRATLDQLDDRDIEVAANPGDAPVIGPALDRAGVTVVSDPSVAPGDARVRGEWASADLTRAATLEALRAQLTEETQGA